MDPPAAAAAAAPAAPAAPAPPPPLRLVKLSTLQQSPNTNYLYMQLSSQEKGNKRKTSCEEESPSPSKKQRQEEDLNNEQMKKEIQKLKEEVQQLQKALYVNNYIAKVREIEKQKLENIVSSFHRLFKDKELVDLTYRIISKQE